MPRRLTLYLSDAEIPIHDRFKESGGNLSEMLRSQLRHWDFLDKIKRDYEPIELEVPEPVKFFGKWIWRRRRDDGTLAAGVAQTRKGRLLHYWNWPDDRGAAYQVYNSLEDMDIEVRQETENALVGNYAQEFLDI